MKASTWIQQHGLPRGRRAALVSSPEVEARLAICRTCSQYRADGRWGWCAAMECQGSFVGKLQAGHYPLAEWPECQHGGLAEDRSGAPRSPIEAVSTEDAAGRARRRASAR